MANSPFTLDDLIKSLEEFRTEHGGSLPVFVNMGHDGEIELRSDLRVAIRAPDFSDIEGDLPLRIVIE